MIDFSHIDEILTQAVPTVTPAAQLTIWQHGQEIYANSFGWLDPETRQRPTQPGTLFDLASVTKLFVATTFMILVEKGKLALDQPVSRVLPEFNSLRPIQPYEDPLKWGSVVQVANGVEQPNVDAGKVTWRNLLAHNSGLPAWRAFKDQPDAASARRLALETFFFYPTGTRVVYSDVGMILTGMGIEKVTNLSLDLAVKELLIDPLGLASTRYFPIGAGQYDLDKFAPTEFCKWRNRRVIGEVHDESTARLGGVAGHAGLFSNAQEVARFGQLFLDGGRPLLSRASIAEMTRLQAQDGDTRRGLGFALWSPDPEASSNPFSQQAFGHTGFTGTCIWIDPQRQSVVVLLTNEVYHGRESRGIMPLRVQVHRAVVEELDRAAREKG